jgi:hypothetical protein
MIIFFLFAAPATRQLSEAASAGEGKEGSGIHNINRYSRNFLRDYSYFFLHDMPPAINPMLLI